MRPREDSNEMQLLISCEWYYLHMISVSDKRVSKFTVEDGRLQPQMDVCV